MANMQDIRISPSVLNADRENLQHEISRIASVSDLIHLDIMDDKFVPNFSWDFSAAEAIIKGCPIPVDAHLMIEDVDRLSLDYAAIGTASVTIHVEASTSPRATLKSIRSAGSRAGLALKPGTALTDYEDLLVVVDMFLIMTVEPGFGGQSFMGDMMEKVRQTRKLIGDRPIWLQVDGGISLDTIAIAREAGADTFVAGSAVFKSPDPAEMVNILRQRAASI